MQKLQETLAPEQHQSNAPEKLSTEACQRIIEEVKTGLVEVFGDKMLFGFVCGGVANGYADNSHDIDVVVCTKDRMDEETQQKYYQWYFDLHQKHQLPPDYDYPGEVIEQERLLSTLALLDDLELTLHITQVEVKKAIIWCDMITGGIDAITGPHTEMLEQIRQDYGHHPAQWKEKVLSLIPAEERPQWEDKSHTLIMERYMKYPKHDGKKLESVYGVSS